MKRLAGLSTGPLGPDPAVDDVLAWLDLRRPQAVVVRDGVPGATRLGEGLRARGARLLAWAAPGVASGRGPAPAELAAAAQRAGRAGAKHVLVAGGPRPAAAADLPPAVEALVRMLHGALRSGTPIAVLGGGAADLLAHEELGWVLDELPGVRVAFDVAVAHEAGRQAGQPAAADALDRRAGRIAFLLAAGRTSDGQAGAHPEEGAIPWGTLAERAPRAAPWILDLAPGTAEEVVADAWRWLGAWTG